MKTMVRYLMVLSLLGTSANLMLACVQGKNSVSGDNAKVSSVECANGGTRDLIFPIGMPADGNSHKTCFYKVPGTEGSKFTFDFTKAKKITNNYVSDGDLQTAARRSARSQSIQAAAWPWVLLPMALTGNPGALMGVFASKQEMNYKAECARNVKILVNNGSLQNNSEAPVQVNYTAMEQIERLVSGLGETGNEPCPELSQALGNTVVTASEVNE